MKNKLKSLIIAVLILTSASLLNACAKNTVIESDTTNKKSGNSNDRQQEAQTSTLSSTKVEDILIGTWHVEKIATRPVIDRSPAQFIFLAKNMFAGSASCNNMSSNYVFDSKKGTLTFGPAAVTRKMCMPALMEQETRFLSALSQVNKYQIQDGMLILFDKNNVLIFKASKIRE